MMGVLGFTESVGPIHAALTCVNSTAGQTFCTESSTGFFASIGILLIIEIAIGVLAIVAAVKVVSKAGYSGWWVLIAIIPIVGSVFFLVFAFSTWPVTLEVQRLRAQLAGRNYGAPGGYGSPEGYGGQRGPTGSGGGPAIGGGLLGPAQTDPEHAPIPSFGQFLRNEAGSGDPPADASSPAMAQHPPAGWFPAPGGPPGQQRYWDGTTWTEHFA
jgi:uncharacterized membrane protein YhaH (DUF805 family)